MRDYPTIDTHTHTFPTREVGRQATQALPHPGASGVVEHLLPDLAAAGFARAVMLNFTATGEMREGNLVREAKGTAPAQWGALHYGRVIADGPRAEVRRDPQVREIYLGA